MNTPPSHRDSLDEIRELAARKDMETRWAWWFRPDGESASDDPWSSNYGPVLAVTCKHARGVLVWMENKNTYTAIGGTNTEPVTYGWEEFTDAVFPAGVELPIDLVVAAIEQFILRQDRPDVVEWADIRPEFVDPPFLTDATD